MYENSMRMSSNLRFVWSLRQRVQTLIPFTKPNAPRAAPVVEKKGAVFGTDTKKRKRKPAPQKEGQDEHRKAKKSKKDQRDEGSKPPAENLAVAVPNPKLDAKPKKRRPKLHQSGQDER